MEGYLRLIAAAAVATVAAALLKKYGGEFAALLAVGCVCLLGVYAVRTAGPVLALFRELRTASGLSSAVLAPVLKTALIGILTGIASAVCADGGQSGMARAVELCGTVLALSLSAPLVTAVLELLKKLTEG